MGLFNFSKKNKRLSKNIIDIMPELKFSDYSAFSAACMGRTIAYQTRFEDRILKNEEWIVDIKEGKMDVSGCLYPIQIIGIETTENPTWLWAWASTQKLPEELLTESYALKSFGESYSFTELTKPSLISNDMINGNFHSSVASSLSSSNVCYYRCPYSGGSIYLLVRNLPENLFSPLEGDEMLKTIRNTIGKYKIDHISFVRSIMLHSGKKHKKRDNIMSCVTIDKKKLTVTFDESNKIYSAYLINL